MEVGAIAFCLLKIRKLRFKPKRKLFKVTWRVHGRARIWVLCLSDFQAHTLDYCTALLLSDLDKLGVFWTSIITLILLACCLLLALKHIGCTTYGVETFILSVLSMSWFLVWDIQRWTACGQEVPVLIITANTLHNHYTKYSVVSTNWGVAARM